MTNFTGFQPNKPLPQTMKLNQESMIDNEILVKKEERDKVPIWEKYALTISEAVKYFGIGEKKLRSMVGEEYTHPKWVMFVGSKALIKREKFSKYLDEVDVI